MELRVLRYFLTVAREGSITGAAQVLHITQPTLSKQLMELEDELGKVLFLRGKRKITLTEDGILLRRRAEEILDLVDKTEKEMLEDTHALAGDIYIGGGETVATALLAEAAGRLRQNYPLVHFHLYSSNTEDVLERLDKGLLDFGILIGAADPQKYDSVTFPVCNSWGVLMRKDHPLAAKEHLRLEDLKSTPMLYSRHSIVRDILTSSLGLDLNDPNLVGSFNLIHNASVFVEHGVGCVLTFDKLVPITEDGLLNFRLLEPPLTTPLHLAWKKHQIFSRAAGKYLEILRQVIAEYVPEQD